MHLRHNNEIMNSGQKPSEYVNYEDLLAREAQELEQVIRQASRSKDLRFGTWGSSVISSYNTLAKSHTIQKEYADARRHFYNSARLATELIQVQRKGLFPGLPQNEPLRPYHQRFTDGFPEAILSGDEVLLRTFAESLDHTQPIATGQKFSHLVTTAIKFLVIGEVEKAREQAVLSHKLEYFRLPYKGYSHAILGIIERDMLLVNEGIELRVKSHKGREYGSAFWEFSHEATALARLAVRAGLHPNLNSPFVCEPLAHAGDRTTDDSVDRILANLEIAEKRNGKLLWSMLRLFPGVR